MLGAMHEQCATHMPDAMHERTNELTNADFPPNPARDDCLLSNARGITGYVYLVHWEQARFTKVGFTTSSRRWQHFVGRGAHLLGVIESSGLAALENERFMHRTLRRRGLLPAFACKADAAPYLGQNGSGYSECYVDNTGRDVLAHLIAELSHRRASA